MSFVFRNGPAKVTRGETPTTQHKVVGPLFKELNRVNSQFCPYILPHIGDSTPHIGDSTHLKEFPARQMLSTSS